MAIAIIALPLASWFVYPQLPYWFLDYPFFVIDQTFYVIAAMMTVMFGIVYFWMVSRWPTTSADWLVILALVLNLAIIGPSALGDGNLPTTAEVREQVHVADVKKRFAEIVAREQQ